VSIATTFLPDLARLAANSDHTAFADRMSRGITLTALFTVPASFGLFVLSKPIIGLVLQHGNFSSEATVNTARALSGLALGLTGFSVYLFVLRGFYAQHDTRTPFFINLCENAINIVLGIVLVDRFDVLGLGIAFSIAYVVSAIIATVVLASNNKAIRLGGLAIDILRIIVAGVAMAIAVRFGSDMFISSDSSLTISVAGLAALTRVLVGITIGGVTYIAALALLGEPHLRNYWLTRTTKSSR
jgi:putative peptidoglycan lipid II flippase